MAYCTNTDVKVYVGTTVSDADLTAMITDSDRVILAFFTARKLTADTDAAKAASILLTRAAVAERFHLTGENPAGYSSGDYSQSGSVDQLGQAKSLQEQAYKILNDYVKLATINAATLDSQADTKRADAVLGDFKLDQSDDPAFFDEWDTHEE